MPIGKRNPDRQPAMWITKTDLPTAASHPFNRRFNQLLREHGFDDYDDSHKDVPDIAEQLDAVAAVTRNMPAFRKVD